jgi:hypothetical protein
VEAAEASPAWVAVCLPWLRCKVSLTSGVGVGQVIEFFKLTWPEAMRMMGGGGGGMPDMSQMMKMMGGMGGMGGAR